MKERGLVLKADKNKKTCLVFTPDGQFKEVPLPPGGAVTGCEVSWEEKRVVGKFLRYLRPLAAAAALCVFLLAGQWLYVLTSTAAYFTVDINPSIELALAQDSRVLAARGLNADGKKLLMGMNLKGRPLTEAAGLIVTKTASLNYFNSGEEGFILATITVKEGRALAFEPQEAARALESAATSMGVSAEVIVQEVKPGVRREAVKAGLSTGRYLLIQAAFRKGVSLDPTEVSSSSLASIVKKQKMSLKELMDTGKGRAGSNQDNGLAGDGPGRGDGGRQEEVSPGDRMENSSVEGAGKRESDVGEPGQKRTDGDAGRAKGKPDLGGQNPSGNGAGKKEVSGHKNPH